MKWLILVLFSVTLFGCGESIQPSKQRWSAYSPHAEDFVGYGENEALITQLKLDARQQNIGNKKVIRTQQQLDGVPVEGTWFQEIAGKEGEIESYSYNFIQGIPDSVVMSAKQMQKDKNDILKIARNDYRLLKKSPQIISTEVVIEPDTFSPQPWLKVVFVAPDEQSVLSFYLNSGGRLKKSSRYQHDFTNGVGFVFYSAPDESELTEQLLKNLKGDGTLGSQHLSVESAIQPTPVSENNVFRLNTEEREFDLLQAYYFVDQMINWFSDQLKVSLGYPLNIKVHVGGMQPTNAAFFYAGNIRLGEGDGKVYQKIPRDPSIVSHEAAHAYVEKLSGLGFEDEAGSYSEAFSDFFTAASLGRPEMGFFSYLKGPYKRTIDNDQRADRDLKGKKYNDSLVISGTFWDIKKILGTEKAIKLAKAFLIELGPGGKIADLPEVLDSVKAQVLPTEDHHVIDSVLEQRGWRNL